MGRTCIAAKCVKKVRDTWQSALGNPSHFGSKKKRGASEREGGGGREGKRRVRRREKIVCRFLAPFDGWKEEEEGKASSGVGKGPPFGLA